MLIQIFGITGVEPFISETLMTLPKMTQENTPEKTEISEGLQFPAEGKGLNTHQQGVCLLLLCQTNLSINSDHRGLKNTPRG